MISTPGVASLKFYIPVIADSIRELAHFTMNLQVNFSDATKRHFCRDYKSEKFYHTSPRFAKIRAKFEPGWWSAALPSSQVMTDKNSSWLSTSKTNKHLIISSAVASAELAARAAQAAPAAADEWWKTPIRFQRMSHLSRFQPEWTFSDESPDFEGFFNYVIFITS